MVLGDGFMDVMDDEREYVGHMCSNAPAAERGFWTTRWQYLIEFIENYGSPGRNK